ncbi:hypothetical protein PM082_014228 [Marasmius tenuissimus]|nr:hypothetical protein PM082_014228 [Marasmius tenuissimus]
MGFLHLADVPWIPLPWLGPPHMKHSPIPGFWVPRAIGQTMFSFGGAQLHWLVNTMRSCLHRTLPSGVFGFCSYRLTFAFNVSHWAVSRWASVSCA